MQRAAQARNPELRQLVMEASQALARLDAGRLEELALSCKALNRELARPPLAGVHSDLPASGLPISDLPISDLPVSDLPVSDLPIRDLRHASLARQAREAQADMAVFARVLDATRDNLHVLSRLRDLRAGRLEYTPLPQPGWADPVTNFGANLRPERAHGDH